MRNHCRKLASLVEHHESRADLAENSLKVWQQRKKASSREEYVEYVRVPRRGNNYTPSSLSHYKPIPADLQYEGTHLDGKP